VLSRLFLVRTDGRSPAGRRKLARLAQPLVDLGRPAAVNQALMDLGSTICKPTQPACPQCPLARQCRAKRSNRQAQFPSPAKRKRTPHYDVVAGVIWRRGQVLIDQRPAKGLLGGLWEIPGGKVNESERPQQALAREVREELNVQVEVGELLASVRHAYSHFRVTIGFYQCRYVAGRTRAIGCAAFRWVRPRQLRQYAFPRANRTVIDQLLS
jgi:A/G-specific adenine glycosylase